MFHIRFWASEEITISGIGFFGPIDADSEYKITVSLSNEYSCGEGETQKISAKQNSIMYYTLKEGFVVKPNATVYIHYRLWVGKSSYFIRFGCLIFHFSY